MLCAALAAGTIALDSEKFDCYRFADYKEKVIDLLQRVTAVSVETMALVVAMTAAQR